MNKPKEEIQVTIDYLNLRRRDIRDNLIAEYTRTVRFLQAILDEPSDYETTNQSGFKQRRWLLGDHPYIAKEHKPMSSQLKASTPSDRYVGTLTFNRPLKLEYLEVGGKHGLFEGNLLVAVVGECCSDHAESFAREIQKRVNEREELIGALRAALPIVESAYLDDYDRDSERGTDLDSESTKASFEALQTIKAMLAKVEGE